LGTGSAAPPQPEGDARGTRTSGRPPPPTCSPHTTLGLIAESGAAGTPDFPAAAEHYRIAVQLEHPSAQLRYGIALLTGRGVEIDPFHAESGCAAQRLPVSQRRRQSSVTSMSVQATSPQIMPRPRFAAPCRRGRTAGAAKMLGHLLLTGGGCRPRPGGSCSLVACRHRRW
jgi:hypothetical protein